mgnify:CR=1 FL=1
MKFGLSYILIIAAVMFVSGLGFSSVGGVTFTVTTWLFSTIQERLSSGPAARLAPVMSALGVWLAVQAFAGIL